MNDKQSYIWQDITGTLWNGKSCETRQMNNIAVYHESGLPSKSSQLKHMTY